MQNITVSAIDLFSETDWAMAEKSMDKEITSLNEFKVSTVSLEKELENKSHSQKVSYIKEVCMKPGQSEDVLVKGCSMLARLMAEHVYANVSMRYKPAEQALVDIGKTHQNLWRIKLYDTVIKNTTLPYNNAEDIAAGIDASIEGYVYCPEAGLY